MIRTIAIALCFTLLAPTVADAATRRARARAKRLAKKAAGDFRAKRYERALTSFEKAYDLVELPALRYNIGQCHLLLGHYDAAIASFQSFLQEEPDTPYRKDVEALIAEAEAELEKLHPPPPPPPPVITAPPPPPPPPVFVEAPPPPVEDDDSGFPTWAIWAIVGGVAVAGGTAAVIAAQPETTTVLPMGDLGVIDRRGLSR